MNNIIDIFKNQIKVFYTDDIFYRIGTDEAIFPMLKNKEMVEYYQLLSKKLKSVENIVEIGTFEGGGTLFLNHVFQPASLFTIDSRGFNDKLDTAIKIINANISQINNITLPNPLLLDFVPQNIDIVVDDGSHFLNDIRKVFYLLWPRLKSGGLYIIEDWCWKKYGGYWLWEHWRNRLNPYYGKDKHDAQKFVYALKNKNKSIGIQEIKWDINMVTIIKK